MTSAPRTVLVVPCYNEAARLDATAFGAALADDPTLALLFVDDGSTDATAALLAAMAAAHGPRARLRSLSANGGKAEAVRLGLGEAIASGAEYVGYWDADLATPLDAARGFVAFLDAHPRCDGVLGSRVLLLGRRIERRAARHYCGRVFATAASLALGIAVYDTQCGAKLFRASAALGRALEVPFRTRWAFDVELIARLYGVGAAAARRCTLCEVPLATWCDVPGSKVTMLGAVKATLDLGRIAWHYRRRAAGDARPAPADWAPIVGRASRGDGP
jgi:glycosyltransferase involved in cell wall biosynthesis